MPRVQAHAQVGQPAADALPDPRVIRTQHALAGEVQVDPLFRPGGCDVDGAADRSGAAAHDDHRVGAGQPVVCGAQPGPDLVGRLQRRLPPEAISDPRRDDQRVVSLGDGCAVFEPTQDGSASEVHARQCGLNRPYPVQTAEPVERNPVVAGPVVGAGEPDAELLTAHQRRFDRDSDDVGVPGQADRGQDAHVSQSGDDDAFAI